MLHLLFGMKVSAVQLHLTLYTPSMRSLHVIVESMDHLWRKSSFYTARIQPRLQHTFVRIFNCMLGNMEGKIKIHGSILSNNVLSYLVLISLLQNLPNCLHCSLLSLAVKQCFLVTLKRTTLKAYMTLLRSVLYWQTNWRKQNICDLQI